MKERKHYALLKETILTCHNRIKNLSPLLSTHRTTQTHQLVTCRIDGRKSRIRGKVVKNKNNENEELPWGPTMKFVNSDDTNHRRKPAPAMSDCGPDPKSLLKRTHSAPEVPSDKKIWQFLTSSVSAFQLLLKFPPPQIQVLGLLVDLKTNRDETDPNLP